MASSRWAKKLREYNERRGRDISESPLEREDTQEDKELLKETYLQFKGEGNKYKIIPKFYTKVLDPCIYSVTQ